MLLAALIDAGCPLDVVRDAAHACGVDELTVDVEEVSRAGLRALPLRLRIDAVPPPAAALLPPLGLPQAAPLRLRAVGHGAGTRDDPRRPNVTRCWLGDAVGDGSNAQAAPQFTDRCVELRTNLDDATPAV